MKIELFEHHHFSEFLILPLPENLEVIYSKIEQEKKIPLHRITLIYNGTCLPKKGKTIDFDLKENSTLRLILPIPINLTELSQTEGPCCGGTKVRLIGRFPYSSRKYKVIFGSSEAFAMFENHNCLSVITPPHDPGVVNVTVCYEGGEESNPLLFTFVRFEGFNRKFARCVNVPTFSLSDAIQFSVQ